MRYHITPIMGLLFAAYLTWMLVAMPIMRPYFAMFAAMMVIANVAIWLLGE